MHKMFSIKLIFLALFLSINIFANTVFTGSAKEDVNVRTMPDYDSSVSYVLRKDQDVNIYAIIKTQNKGTWYKIDNGYVVLRFVNTDATNISTETFSPENLEEQVNTKEETLVQEPKIEQTTETVTEESKPNYVVVEDIKEAKEDEITNEIKPSIEKSDEESGNSIIVVNEEKIQEKTFVEPIVIKKEESFITKYINFEYVIYIIGGIIVLIILITVLGKIFSRPSITDQISQHQKRNAHLKKALSSGDDK